jgi:hypothetical protein
VVGRGTIRGPDDKVKTMETAWFQRGCDGEAFGGRLRPHADSEIRAWVVACFAPAVSTKNQTAMTQSTPFRSADQTVMMAGACLLFFGGLAIGVPVTAPGAPIIGLAHTLGLIEAVFMFAFVVLRPHLRFSPFNAWLFCAVTFAAFYTNFAGVSVTVLTGAGAGEYLPPWGAFLDNAPSPTNTLVAYLLNASALALVLPLMLFAGWIDRTHQSDRLQTATAVVSVLATIGLVVLTVMTS